MPEDLLNEFAPHRPGNVSILDILVARAQRNDFSDDLNEAITMLYQVAEKRLRSLSF
ncbi:MAG: hypothetical protein ACRD3T_21715 [Terriglobia bacterium]